MSTYSWQHSSRRREQLVQEAQPHPPIQICAWGTESSTAHFISQNKSAFHYNMKNTMCPDIQGLEKKYPILQALVVSPTVPCCSLQESRNRLRPGCVLEALCTPPPTEWLFLSVLVSSSSLSTSFFHPPWLVIISENRKTQIQTSVVFY